MNPKLVGEKSEACIILALLRHDWPVLKPFGDSQRYDLVTERNGQFLRIQCKTGRLVDGAVSFPTCSSYRHRGLGTKDYRGQADLFAVYCPDNEKTYIVPVDDVGTRTCRLRVLPSKNGQRDGVRPAQGYELARFPGLLKDQRPATMQALELAPGVGLEPTTH
jgi:hypothetical protein